MKKAILLVTLLMIVSTYTFANNNTPNNNAGQSFIVTNTNDTLFGEVTLQLEENAATVSFTNGETGENKSYEPFQIKGYADKGTFFESKLYNLSKEMNYGYNVFMERKADGFAKVYHFTDKDKTKIFIENEAGKMTEVSGMNFRTEMSKFFDNCPPLKAKILRGVYKKKDLEMIVADYNKWKTKG